MDIHLDSIDSTQTFARANLRLFPKDRVSLVSADQQTGGKGTHGRSWVSPKGNLYLTFVLPLPNHKIHQAASLSLILARVTADICHLEVKQPNDLMLNHAKVGGVLGEVIDGVLLLGLGLNVLTAPENLDRPTAIVGNQMSLTSLKEAIKEKFSNLFSEWCQS